MVDYDDGINEQYELMEEESGLNNSDMQVFLGSEAKDYLIVPDELWIGSRIGAGMSGNVYEGRLNNVPVAVKVYISIYLYVSLSLCFCVSVCLSLCLSISLSTFGWNGIQKHSH